MSQIHKLTNEHSPGIYLQNMKNELKKKGHYEESFVKPKDIFNAIARKTKKITHYDFKDSINTENITSFKEISSQALYSVIVDYTLAHDISSFVSLDDDDHSNAIKSIDKNSIEHCHNERSEKFQVGNILIASERNNAEENKYSNPFQKYIDSKELRRSKSFKVIRRITNVIEVREGKCTRFETEDLHPMELIESFDMKSNVTNPFHTTYYPTYEKAHSNKKTDFFFSYDYSDDYETNSQGIRSPDSPLTGCSDTNFWYYRPTTDSNSYAYVYGTSYACAEFINSFPGSFNYNYDPNSNSAKTKDIYITNGVSCRNCYLYFGASYFLHVEYSLSRGMGAEVVLSGGAGAKADILLTNPSISGYASYKIIDNSQGSFASLSVGTTGITIGVKFDSLTVGVSGSGSATGTAYAAGGASADASATAMYSPSSKYFSAGYNVNSFTPFYSSNLKFTNFRVQTDLNFKTLFRVGVLSNWVSVTFDTTSKAYMSYSYSSSMSYAAVSIGNSRRRLTNESDIDVLTHGQTLKINLIYKKFAANENTTIFYSFVSESINEIPFLIKHFVTSSTGEGIYEVDWLVPWDESLIMLYGEKINKNYKIQVRCSNQIENTILSNSSVKLDLYSDFDSIFSSPSNNQIVSSIDSYNLQWKRELLKHFETVDVFTGYGIEKTCENVQIYIVSERLNQQDLSLNSSKQMSLSVTFVKNTGYFTTKFPANISEQGDRFYLQVECEERPYVFGWSSGYFYFSNESFKSATTKMNILSEMNQSTESEHRLLIKSNIIDNNYASRSNNNKELATSCNSQYPALLRMGVEMSFGLENIYAIWNYPLNINLGTVSLMVRDTCTTGSLASEPTPRPIQPTLKPTTCIVPDISWVGDGYCDTGEYNTAICNYDGGDCCAETCISSGTYICGTGDSVYVCLNPTFMKPPTLRPIQPTPQPIQPTLRPIQPTLRPIQPTPQPIQPTLRPIQPTPQPIQPTLQPIQPTLRPIQPTPQPVQPTLQPTLQPIKPTLRPIQPTLQPSSFPTAVPSTINPSTSLSTFPTFAPSVKSSIMPSINPSTVSTIRPSLSPSKSPSSSTSNIRSFIPSVGSSVFSTRPLASLAPSLPPTYMITNSQTIKPTNIPNNLPILTSTLNPTMDPSSEVPTYIPTPLPAPKISFINTMTVQLKLGCLAMNDNKTRDTFLQSQSEVMNISESNLYYQGCSKVNRRLLSKDMNSQIRLQDSSYDLATKVVIELSRTDTGGGGDSDKIINTAASAIFLKLSTALATSVKNGTFAKIMQATAKSLGLNTNSSTFQVMSTASTGLQVTIYTHSPTKIPTIYQTITPTSHPVQETVVTNNVSTGAIVGIAVAVVVIVSILVALIYYLRRNQLKKEATVFPDTDYKNATVKQYTKVKVDQKSINRITNDRQHHIADDVGQTDDVGQAATNQNGDLHIYDIDEFGEAIVKSH